MSTDRQASIFSKAFTNKSLANIKLFKTQLSKIVQSGGWQGRLPGSLIRIGLPLMKNVPKTLAKSFAIRLALTVAASVSDAGKHKKKIR